MTRNTSSPASFAGLTLERLPQVRARTGLSRSEVYRRISTSEFPMPVKIGTRASAWNSAEIDAWIASRIALRDQGAKR
jgi:prophage regulatory protein